MATNEILPFAQGGGANVLTQAAYAADSQRPIGNQPGVARGQLVNKALLQLSALAAGAAQFLADKQGTNITDQLTAAQMSTAWQAAVKSLVGGKSGYLDISVAGALPATAIGALVRLALAASGSVQLPSAAASGAGATISIFNGLAMNTAVVTTLTSVAGNFILLGSAGSSASFILRAGLQYDFVSDGADWRLVNGLGGASLANPGFHRTSSGLILQWGVGTAGQSGSSFTNTFPLAFPNACFAVVPVHNGTDQSVNVIVDGTPGLTSFGARSSFGASNVNILYSAFGF